jgi:serine/threonine protein kinase
MYAALQYSDKPGKIISRSCSFKVFARKIFIAPHTSKKDWETEGKAITKICGKGAHAHIVAVLKLGQLLNSPYFYIDMELCDLNLSDFIYSIPAPHEPSTVMLPQYIKNGEPPLKASQIWNVMRQIASGVKYIHSLDVVHRDLKPANGK